MIGSLKRIVKRVHNLSQNKSIWSLADQGVVSLGNFLTNILLARHLPPSDYGNYILIYGVILFLNSTHTALIVYPLSVKGAVAAEVELRKITTHYLMYTVILTLLYSSMTLVAVNVVGKPKIAFIVAGALLFWQMQETVRRALMSHLRHSEALWGDGVSYIGQSILVMILGQKGWLSTESAFLVMALTSFVAAFIQIIQLKLRTIFWRDIWNSVTAAWDLGKWMLIGSLTAIIYLHATPWILAIFHGTTETASVQAVVNILGASNPILISTGNLMIPLVAKANIEGGMKLVNKVVVKYTLQGGIFLAPFYGALLLFPQQGLELMYGKNSPYISLDNVLRLFTLSYILLYLSQAPSSILAGLEKSKLGFMSQMGSVGSSIFIGIPLIIQIGGIGAGISSISAQIVKIVINIFQIRMLKLVETRDSQIK